MLSIAKALAEDDEFTFSLFPQDNKYFDYATKVRLAAIATHLKLDGWEWNHVVERMVEIVVRKVYTDVHSVLNGILSTLFATVTLDRQPQDLKGVPNWNELSGAYYFSIE